MSLVALPPSGSESDRPPSPAAPSRQITFLETVNVLLRDRALIVMSAVVTASILCTAALVADRTYTASASFVAKAGNVPGGLSGMAAQLGVSIPTSGESESPQFYVDLIHSRAILRALAGRTYESTVDGKVVRGSLADFYEIRRGNPPRRRELTIRRLSKDVSSGVATKTGIVTAAATMPNPALAKAVTDSLLAELNVFNLERRRSQAGAERRFAADRLREVKDSLNRAEDRLVQFRSSNRDIRGSQLLTLRDAQISREVDIQQTLYSSVLQMYEQAKLDEVRDTPVITILEHPEAPIDPDPRGLIARGILGLVVGSLIGIVLAFGREGMRRAAADYPTDLFEYESLKREAMRDVLFPWRPLVRAIRTGKDRRGNQP